MNHSGCGIPSLLQQTDLPRHACKSALCQGLQPSHALLLGKSSSTTCLIAPSALQANLYSLVWRRAMASQMESAEMQQVRVTGPGHPLAAQTSRNTVVLTRLSGLPRPRFNAIVKALCAYTNGWKLLLCRLSHDCASGCMHCPVCAMPNCACVCWLTGCTGVSRVCEPLWHPAPALYWQLPGITWLAGRMV